MQTRTSHSKNTKTALRARSSDYTEDPMKQKERAMKPIWDALKKLMPKDGKKLKMIDVDELLAEALAEDYDRIVKSSSQ